MATVSLNLDRHIKASCSRTKAGGPRDNESDVMAALGPSGVPNWNWTGRGLYCLFGTRFSNKLSSWHTVACSRFNRRRGRGQSHEIT